MFGEYGYMEEGKLGKPYNFKLLKRLLPYCSPYKKTITAALLLTILITLFDLAVPYLSKIAIDRYILSSWYRVNMEVLTGVEADRLLKRYGYLLDKSPDGSMSFVSNQALKKMDPGDIHVYKSRGAIGPERLYRAGPDVPRMNGLENGRGTACRMADGSVLVPYQMIEGLPDEKIMQIRAGDIRGVALIGTLFFFFLILTFGLNYLEFYLLEFTGQHIMQDIRLRLFRRMQSRAISFFVRNPIGRLVTRVTNDIENLNEMFKSVVVTLFKDFFLVTGILAVLLCLNWRLALLSFALLPFIFGLTFLFSTMAREAFRELRATVARINAFLQERLTGMRVIQLFAREKFQMDTFGRINHENYLAGIK
ncbi:MAG: ABC transporter ATP-binding protein, partial [Thermoproteota archaeon]